MATTPLQQAAVNPVAAQNQPPIQLPPQPMAGPPIRPQVSASLYIGDLDPEIGESTLYDLFKDIGSVASIRVCKDAITKVSLGYAYVNFLNVESAEKAISVLNGTVLNKRPCRIMWSRRDPSIRKSGIGNIFIKNLGPEMDHSQLYDLFSVFGNIYSCKLVTGKNGQSKGYGFVHFHTKEAADLAIAKMSTVCINDKPVYIAPFVPKRERQQKNPDDIYTNVFVKNISETVTDPSFLAHFSKFGTITSAKLATDEEGKSKGFGFINYSNHEEAIACVNSVNNIDFNGKALYAARAQSKAERAEQLKKKREEQANKYHGVNLYIKNIEDSVDEEKLRKVFSEFGGITSLKIMTNEKGQSKGFGFVCYSKPDEATKALTKMNNFMFEGKPLYVALAQRKEQRRAQLEAQHAQQRTNMQVRLGQPGQLVNPIYPPMFYPQNMPGPTQNRPSGYIFPTPSVGQPFGTRNTRSYTGAQQGPGNFQQQQPIFPNQGGVGGRGRATTQRGGSASRGSQPVRSQQVGGIPQTGPNNQPQRKPQPNKAAGEVSSVGDVSNAAELVFSHLQYHPTSAIEQIMAKLTEAEITNFAQDPSKLDARATQILEEIGASN